MYLSRPLAVTNMTQALTVLSKQTPRDQLTALPQDCLTTTLRLRIVQPSSLRN